MDPRLAREIEHGKRIVAVSSGELWYWETPAGKRRWERRVQMLSSHITPEMIVLEVGCGSGYFTKVLTEKKATTIAIDISLDFLKAAKRNVPGVNVKFSIGNACNLGFRENTFDSIVGSSVLHHLKIDDALKEFYRILKPGGSVYFTEPNMMNPQILVQKNIPIIKEKLGDSPDETAFFRWPLKNQLIKYGFRDVEIKKFDFLHPNTPKLLIPLVEWLGDYLESLPIISEIAGSLSVKAFK